MLATFLIALVGTASGGGPDPLQGERPMACTDRVQSEAVPSPHEALAKAGVALASDAKVDWAVRLPADCAKRVSAVFAGGVILSTGESFELQPNGFQAMGQARRNDGDPCGNNSLYEKCITIRGVGGAALRLSKAGRGQVLEEEYHGRTRKLVSAKGARLVDIAYLSSPDSAGGNITVFVTTAKEGYMLIIESPA